MAAPFEAFACQALPAPLRWARSGAMALCGPADGAPRVGAASLATAADTLLGELRARAARQARLPEDGAALLGERAAILGLARRGQMSPGGSCRLLRAADGWIAPNLARPEDVELLPAWLELGVDRAADPWAVLAEAVRSRSVAELVARGRLMGLAVADTAISAMPADAPPGVRARRLGAPRERSCRRPLVVDLSALWAGPLCTHLLERAGARVVKVESTTRPDGARRGPSGFFDLMNAGKASVALDFRKQSGRLRRLIERADVVIEASRPRALRQLGIDAGELLASVPGLVWVSITGHGREPPGADWIAFGDDAAVAAGLAVATGSADEPLFCADAVADPLAGLHAAAAAVRSLAAGGGERLDVSLVGSARAAFAPIEVARVFGDGRAWWVECEGEREPVAAPRARRPSGRARPLGADTEGVLRELAC